VGGQEMKRLITRASRQCKIGPSPSSPPVDHHIAEASNFFARRFRNKTIMWCPPSCTPDRQCSISGYSRAISCSHYLQGRRQTGKPFSPVNHISLLSAETFCQNKSGSATSMQSGKSSSSLCLDVLESLVKTPNPLAFSVVVGLPVRHLP
jgi:hypothetical protein